MSKSIQERDKPFILALTSMGAFLTTLFSLMYLKRFELLKDCVVWFSPWISMAWALYFKEKSEK